ncbi:helix-turn-helix transcriptional regulator [Oleispirillum naphthae]|uniref:helix-turn-helix transcriptional regulator n=1 Tax=Oleispirillum naphthae TaxID=2838853 RepID=UPI003082246B
MRHEKAENLLLLAMEMQAARGGLTLDGIAERFAVGRRTAMRMRDAVLRAFPQAEEILGDDRKKRWRIPPATLDRLIAFSADELAAVAATANLMEDANRPDLAVLLGDLSQKIKSLMKADIRRRVEPDLEALMEAEGIAARPGPKRPIEPQILDTLRRAVLACDTVKVRYRTRRDGALQTYRLHPYGFLHGHRHYLVAVRADGNGKGPQLFSLPDITVAEATGEPFVRNVAFDLNAYAAEAFGVFHEPPSKVVWRFAPHAAQTAAEFTFHPAQEREPQADGSLIVRFCAGGLLEMAWHLLAWGDAVEVLEPPALAELVNPHRQHWEGLP